MDYDNCQTLLLANALTVISRLFLDASRIPDIIRTGLHRVYFIMSQHMITTHLKRFTTVTTVACVFAGRIVALNEKVCHLFLLNTSRISLVLYITKSTWITIPATAHHHSATDAYVCVNNLPRVAVQRPN